MTSKSTGLTLLEAQNVNRRAAKNPDQLLFDHRLSYGHSKKLQVFPFDVAY